MEEAFFWIWIFHPVFLFPPSPLSLSRSRGEQEQVAFVLEIKW